MTPEEEAIYQLRTEIDLKKNAIRAQFTKNERKSIIEIIVVLLKLVGAVSLFFFKPCLQVLDCHSPLWTSNQYLNGTFFGYWFYDWFYDHDLGRFGDVTFYDVPNRMNGDKLSWYGAKQFCSEKVRFGAHIFLSFNN